MTPEDIESLSEADREALLRKVLFIPCETKGHLHLWVKSFLGLDLPSSTVCHTDLEHEPSNSNPLDLLWEVYEAARKGDRKKTRFLYYAARGTYKSVLCSVIEALSLFHLRRNVGHMAANKTQSGIVQGYLKAYLQRPVLRDFMTSKNDSQVSVTWYETPDGEHLTPEEYKSLEKSGATLTCRERSYFVKVIVATIGGSNGLHAPIVVQDELDLTPAQIISEANMIPTPDPETGAPAIVVMTSSRKFSMGPVQTAIDNAAKTGTTVRHWNLIDVTKPCPPERHLPHRPKLPVYYSDKQLSTIGQDDYKVLPEELRKDFRKDLAYEGCLKNCRIFAMCRGKLATEQLSDSSLLRDVQDTQDAFIGQLDVEKAQAQLLCWVPSREGMVYPRLYADTHLVSAAHMAFVITGEEYPPSFGKEDLIKLFEENGVRYFAGIDHGYSHCFAGVLGVVWKNTMFVIDAFEVPGLELDGKVRLLNQRFKRFDPAIYPDTSSPSDNKTISKHGFRVKKLEKGPGSVIGGIGIVRMKLSPVSGNRPELYFLKGDQGVEQLFGRMLKYSWVIDAETGNPTDVPREIGDDGKAADDGPDALRYMVMSVFAPRGSAKFADDYQKSAVVGVKPPTAKQKNWNQIAEYVGISDFAEEEQPSEQIKKKKGLIFDLG
jgi:hypothetical protein